MTALFFSLVEKSNKVFSKELYRAMDYLEKNKNEIEEKLMKLNFSDGDLDTLFYDITSSYFDGSSCKLAKYGYSRDHRSDKKQIVISLVVNKNALPVCVEILKGNTVDKTTVKDKIEELNNRFELKEKVIVADRGMITANNIEEINNNNNNYKYILCMNNTKEAKIAINAALEMKFEPFDETLSATEIIKENVRYIVCFSKYKNDIDKISRKDRIDKAVKELKLIQNSINNKQIKDHHKILIKANKIITKRKAKKFITITKLEDGILEYQINNNAIKDIEKYDGIFVMTSTYEKGTCFDIVSQYKSLRKIEKAFHHIKNYIELRPIYHYKDTRVKAHVFICFLSYLLMQTLEKKLQNLNSNYSAATFIDCVKKISLAKININEKNITKISKVDEELQTLINNICNSNFYKNKACCD